MSKVLKTLMVGVLSVLFAGSFGCGSLQSRYHIIQPGETLFSVGRQYGVTLNELKRANPSRMARVIYPGDKVYIPFERSSTWSTGRKLVSKGARSSKQAGLRALRGKGRKPASLLKFQWPVNGRLTGFFGRRGKRRHEGIDIAARKGTRVRAARAGKVIYRGNKLSGYGNIVIVRHPNKMTTVYAHLSRFHVRYGQRVKKGQIIGRVGSTGRSSGNHLHFEVRQNHRPVNPLLYLQGRYASNIFSR